MVVTVLYPLLSTTTFELALLEDQRIVFPGAPKFAPLVGPIYIQHCSWGESAFRVLQHAMFSLKSLLPFLAHDVVRRHPSSPRGSVRNMFAPGCVQTFCYCSYC